jgi:hypothetical protein
MRTAVRPIALVAFSVALMGQAPPKDVTGWDKIKWGMTIAEARAAYAVSAPTEATEYWTALSIPDVVIGDIRLKAVVEARHGSDQITLASLFMSFGLPKDAPLAGPEDFETLKTLLTQKYGKPASDDTTQNVNTHDRTIIWTFQSTSISLKLSQFEARLGSISLRYEAADKKALDKL